MYHVQTTTDKDWQTYESFETKEEAIAHKEEWEDEFPEVNIRIVNEDLMDKVVECGNEGCNHTGDYEEFTNNNIGVALCDDCYTVVCYMVADELKVDRQQLDL